MRRLPVGGMGRPEADGLPFTRHPGRPFLYLQAVGIRAGGRRLIPFAAAEAFGPLPPVAHHPAAMSPDFVDWPYLGGIIKALPAQFVAPVTARYRKEYSKQGQRAANVWIGEVADTVTVRTGWIAASDDEIRNEAKRHAITVSGLMADHCAKLGHHIGITSEGLAGVLAGYCRENGVEAPQGVELRGLVARLVCQAWWRRQLRRTVARKVEGAAIGIGLVHRRAGLYASDETVSRHAEQKRRNAAAMEGTEAVNDRGEVFNLAELAALGVSNPSVRFAELMVRVRGMESHARENGHVGLFVTKTAPSRMHARHSGDCSENDLFDGTNPKQAQGWIARQWARIRAALARLEIHYYGVRVAEPHHDGTPHWHMLIFVDPVMAGGRSAVARVKAIIRRYLLRGDFKAPTVKALREAGATIREAREARHAAIVGQRQAEKADRARLRRACDFKLIDWAKGSAAGYLVKYLAKNISGEKVGQDFESDKPANETAGRVLAWASAWGIRQFQIVGGPPVGVWRELRRVKDAPEQGDLFAAWEATGSKEQGRAPDWGKFIAAQGGIAVRRADRPVQLWKLAEPGRRTRYGDEAAARVAGVVCAGVVVRSRDTVWTLRRAESQEQKKRAGQDRRAFAVAARRAGAVLGLARPKAAQSWTRVNNCTSEKPGPWPGLARNIAGWNAEGNRAAVIEIFNEVRRLKNGSGNTIGA